MGAATTTTTTTVSMAYAPDAVQQKSTLPKQIVDVDTEDTDNNNVSGNNHNSSGVAATKTPANGNVIGTTATAAPTAAEPASADAVSADKQEFDYFGFKVGAKLKWTNIIGIVVIHAMFLYTFTHNPLLPRLYTYAWGECDWHACICGICGCVDLDRRPICQSASLYAVSMMSSPACRWLECVPLFILRLRQFDVGKRYTYVNAC